MRKLSEYKNEDALDLLADILEPVAHIFADKDFVNKLKIVEEEIDETSYWLSLIMDSGMLPKSRVEPLFDECLELCKITTKSIDTFKTKRDF